MILTSDEIRSLCVGPDVVVPLIETPDVHRFDEDAEDIEGGSFDLTLGAVFRVTGESYTGVRTSKTADHIGWNLRLGAWRMLPGSYVFQSKERVNLPPDIRAMVHPRTTIFRNGLVPSFSTAHPGFSGNILGGIFVPGWVTNYTLPAFEYGCRFCSVWFMRIPKPEPRPYHGRWKGSKTQTNGWERAHYWVG